MMTATAIAERYLSRAGEKVGFLTFVSISPNRGDRNRLFGVFSCDCGAQISLPAARVLKQRKRLHCGCRTDLGAHRKHGMRWTPEYSSWQSMKSRCLDPNNKDYARWGGRGITIFPQWIASFEAFYEHIGRRPEGASIDRIDNMRGYEPGNVRWATRRQQQQNRRTSLVWFIKGTIFACHGDAALHFKVSEHTVWRWVNGQFDKRRGRFSGKRDDCWTEPRY